MRAVLVVVLVACGSQHAPPERAPAPPAPRSDVAPPADAPADAPPPPDASPPPPPDAAPPPPHHADMTCPKTLAAAEGNPCDPDGIGMCKYGTTTCGCEAPRDCSGTDGPPRPTYWTCHRPPPKIRPDGCPGVMHEGRCAKQGQRCIYESGCCQLIFECRGTWQHKGQQCPV
jgi:hypothetical protein